MKKFTSFKLENAENVISEKNPPQKHAKVTAISKKKPAPVNRVDFDFGKRLNFAEESKKTEDKIVKERLNSDYTNEEMLKRKQTEFNKKLRKDPLNIDLWIEFVNFQDELNRLENKKQLKLVERKLFILKKAIEFNSSSLRLILLLLKTAEESEDLSSMLKLWEGHLRDKTRFVGTDHVTLTLEYLKYRQRTFLAYNFEHVNEAFSEAFGNHKESSIKFLILLYREYFRFLKRSGYKERMVALTQALIEVCIEQWNYGTIDLEAYEDQWEFGLMEHIGDSALKAGLVESYTENVCSRRFQDWIDLERYRENIQWHPIHNHDDVEGQVLFDDLKDFLVIPIGRNDILELIKAVFKDLGSVFVIKDRVTEVDFVYWYLDVYKALLPFYKNDDWQFILNLFLLNYRIDPCEADSYAKQLLSENRESLNLFLAYGRFQESIGNASASSKVYEALKKRTSQFDEIMASFPSNEYFEPVEHLNLVFSESVLRAEVYEMLRSNPGDKMLLMQIIESVEKQDEQLAMEVYNLIIEQQLRQHALLEEVDLK